MFPYVQNSNDIVGDGLPVPSEIDKKLVGAETAPLQA